MAEKIVIRTVIEVLGKPKEHVEGAMKGYVQKIKDDEKFTVLSEEFAELKKQDNELWATFTEMEMEVGNVQDLIGFCFDYMPSLIEVIKPSKFEIGDKQLADFFNDLQARLHQVDMIAKQVKLESNTLKLNVNKLMRNFLLVLLGKSSLTLEQLSGYTGVAEEKLGDYLDKLLDEGFVTMDKGLYTLNPEKLKKNEQ